MATSYVQDNFLFRSSTVDRELTIETKNAA